MRKPRSLPPLTILLLCLGACAREPALSPPVPVLPSPPAGADDARRAAIRAQIAPACPRPLDAPALIRAADLVDRHPDAAPVVADLDRLDRSARVCRGDPIASGG